MQNIREEMRALLSDMNEQSRLRREVQHLESRQSKLQEKLRDLEGILHREQADVDALSRVTLQSVWLRICGTHEEVLRREQADVDAAALKCGAARSEIEEIKAEIASRRKRLSDLSQSERKYKELLEKKRELMYTSAEGEAMRRMEEETARLTMQQKELREAIDAGGSALHTAGEIVDCLKGANAFATWDVLGGGMLADMAKHSELNSAQVLIERLQHQLRRFQTELSDVQLEADLPIGEFLTVADFMFDGLIADWLMKKRIERALNSMQNTQRQIEYALSCLREKQKRVKRQIEDMENKIDWAVREA